MRDGGWFVCQFCDDGVPKDEAKRAAPCQWCDGTGKIKPQPESAATRELREAMYELMPTLDAHGFSLSERDAVERAIRGAVERTARDAVHDGRCHCPCGGCAHACMRRAGK